MAAEGLPLGIRSLTYSVWRSLQKVVADRLSHRLPHRDALTSKSFKFLFLLVF